MPSVALGKSDQAPAPAITSSVSASAYAATRRKPVVTSEVGKALLSDDRYHIEFNGYLSNHAKHAVVALEGLGAPPQRVKSYWDEYTALTPYGLNLEPAEALPEDHPPLTQQNWQDLIGRKAPGDFVLLLNFFAAEVDRLDVHAAVASYAPKLLEGSPGGLTHGLIHLGWGLDACHRYMTIEGMAYLAYCGVPVHPERFSPGATKEDSPLQSLTRMAEAYHSDHIRSWVDGVLKDPKYSAESGFHPELIQAGFQWNVAKVLAEGHPLLLKMPSWLEEMQYDTAMEQMYKAVVYMYLGTAGYPDVGSSPGNFVVLHLLTSLWALERVSEHLSPEVQRAALKAFWSGSLGIVMASSGGFPSPETLRAIAGQFADLHDSDSGLVDVGEDWGHIIPKALTEDEEHNIKLAYVGRELWRRYGRWSGFRLAAGSFTATPNIGPGRGAFSA